MPKNNENFQTRIIQGSREEKARRILDALINSGKCAQEQLEEFGLTLGPTSGKLKIMDINIEETQRIIADEKLKQSANTQNGIFCAKFIGVVFVVAIVAYLMAKLWEYFH